ncbi:MAG: bifunctional glycosyltransferase family 2/GtrA family protein [Thermoflexaceae bacterium]|nr:bifunctional glycosyltransferase family 2/GtrA family protein [Thermoflexaceae bacterium]
MVTVIIPSLNPDEKLLLVVKSLTDIGFKDIIIVNDGSDKEHMIPFEEAGKIAECTILTHEVNKGKGRALKTAFAYCIANRKGIDGVVTVDGDNQHRAEDILACAKRMQEKKNSVILGTRDFHQKDVPFKSRFGNNMTGFVFRFACGMKISDTQTGLRAIPYEYLPVLCEVSGERFEYETNMLLTFKKLDIPYEEVSIQTVYIDENATTHFHPVRDSFKIYGIIIKFLFGSVSSCLIDLGLFTVLKILTSGLSERISILISTVVARVFSSFYNYNFNRRAVFDSREKAGNTVVRYYILCIVQMMVSYGLVYAANHVFSMGNIMTVVSKAVIDTFLFFISFQIQRVWVFRK